MPEALLAELTAARNRHAAEKLALGEAYNDQGYVVCNEAGEPYHPSTLSTLWQAAIRDLDVPQIRLHDARHTCATLMHLQGVRAHRARRSLARPRRRIVYSPHLRSRPDRGAGTGGTQLCSAGRQLWTEHFAHACGDTQRFLVTICDNFTLVEHSYDRRELHMSSSHGLFVVGLTGFEPATT
jgi:hypothetical protein